MSVENNYVVVPEILIRSSGCFDWNQALMSKNQAMRFVCVDDFFYC